MKQLAPIAICLFCAGCASTKVAEEDTGFAKTPSLEAFTGCYRNCSEPSDGSAPVCLSSIIWPDEFTAETRPKAVYIQKGDGNSLVASAVSDGVLLKQSRFREGEDFELKGGRIELKRDYIASGAREPGNPFIGVVTSKTLLGLDDSGQGRISQSTAFAGTGFLIIPVAGKTSNTQKIERAPSRACSIGGT
ncbi:hypothetical protein [uncultured Marinobacter sp.]|uniref:hypothetical protein n=1 Tax=uncultured Marinobacter sp. TaxID=187379 RepID=UPI0025DEE6B5|nr:hypothetical protein [uncultured Marinobacter sp.]